MTAPKQAAPRDRDWAQERWNTWEIVHATGASYRRVQWADERRIISPAIVGNKREYDWRTALQTILVFALVDHGVPLKAAGRMAVKVDVRELWQNPTCWIVYIRAGRLRGERSPAIVKLFHSTQASAAIALITAHSPRASIVSVEDAIARLIHLKQITQHEARRIISRVQPKTYRYKA